METKTKNHGHDAPRKKGGGPWRIVFVVALTVLIVSLCALAVIAYSYFQGQQKYESIAEMSGLEDVTEQDDLRELSVDWEALWAVNPDTVGWVYIPNTVINYPIVQGDDNEYYLGRDFDGEEGWLADFGTVFLDYRNDSSWSDDSNFVYGHHLNDGSMFAAIGEMDSQDRFEQCRTVYLLTPERNYKLRGYSLVHCAGTEAIVKTEFDDADDMTSYVQDKINRSEFDPGDIPDASEIKKSIAFATCDNTYRSTGRYVLFCYIVDDASVDLGGTVDIVVNDAGSADGFANDLSQEQTSSDASSRD